MKVSELLTSGRPTLSFEFFPPRTAEQETQLYAALDGLKIFRPDFVSVTYGAMGTSRQKSFFWAKEIKQKYQLEPVGHLTCIAATRSDIASQLEELSSFGVANILALRGDPPAADTAFVSPANGFRYAKDLISFIKKTTPALCVGCAGFPEGHPKAGSLAQDTDYLKQKIDAGAEYVMTQLFFDNSFYFAFLERCRQAGIKAPIIPGLMPITSYNQITKLTAVCGATLPTPLLAQLEKHQADPKSIMEIGEEQAVRQCQELTANKVPGLHFFVMNRAAPITDILTALK